MHRLLSAAAVLAFAGGCAAPPHQPEEPAAAADAAAAAVDAAAAAFSADSVSVTPEVTIDVTGDSAETVCENLTRPGSRIVVERRCYTADSNDPTLALQRERVRAQIEMLRHEQEELQRRQRNRDIEAAAQRGASQWAAGQ